MVEAAGLAGDGVELKIGEEKSVDRRERGKYYREREKGLQLLYTLEREREREREACACSPKGVNEVVVDEREVH
jgi:hypothetical protein